VGRTARVPQDWSGDQRGQAFSWPPTLAAPLSAPDEGANDRESVWISGSSVPGGWARWGSGSEAPWRAGQSSLSAGAPLRPLARLRRRNAQPRLFTEPGPVDANLRHLHLPTTAAPLSPARGRPQPQLDLSTSSTRWRSTRPPPPIPPSPSVSRTSWSTGLCRNYAGTLMNWRVLRGKRVVAEVQFSAWLCGFLHLGLIHRIFSIPLEIRRAHGMGFEPRLLAGLGRVCTLVCMFASRKGAKRSIGRSHPFRTSPRRSAKNCQIRG
jgi:hypothetical protein